MLERFVILGASGDLASRYLLPALVALCEEDLVGDKLEILGVAREDWDAEGFRRHAATRLERHAPEASETARGDVIRRLEYARADVTDAERLGSAIPTDEPAVVYLALPGAVFAPTLSTLASIGLAPGSRIVIEKPFGVDLDSARKLNELLHESFPEEAVFRIDHFLHKQTVQNILGLRFANRVFEPLWSNHHVHHVDITWEETLALEERSSYYDSAGALVDMIQNHLLQLLCLVAMEVPATLGERDLRDKKSEVLRSVRRMSADEVGRLTARGRYGIGRIGDRDVPAYVDEPGIDPGRNTETFAEVVLFVDNWRWAGVPFRLRTGKALGRDCRDISVSFRNVPHLAFGQSEHPQRNTLRLALGPDRLSLAVNINGAGDPFDLENAQLAADLAPQELSAYARLLLDVLEGDPTLSIRDDEAEESWEIIEPILRAWRDGGAPLTEYAAGSSGPRPVEVTAEDL